MTIQAQYQGNRHSAGTVPHVIAAQAIAFYDPANGQIRHMHHGITLEGGRPQDAASFERQAREHAERLGTDVAGLQALHVPNFEPTGGRFRVDLQTRKLVRLELPDELRVFRREVRRRKATT